MNYVDSRTERFATVSIRKHGQHGEFLFKRKKYELFFKFESSNSNFDATRRWWCNGCSRSRLCRKKRRARPSSSSRSKDDLIIWHGPDLRFKSRRRRRTGNSFHIISFGGCRFQLLTLLSICSNRLDSLALIAR